MISSFSGRKPLAELRLRRTHERLGIRLIGQDCFPPLTGGYDDCLNCRSFSQPRPLLFHKCWTFAMLRNSENRWTQKSRVNLAGAGAVHWPWLHVRKLRIAHYFTVNESTDLIWIRSSVANTSARSNKRLQHCFLPECYMLDSLLTPDEMDCVCCKAHRTASAYPNMCFLYGNA